MDANFKVRPTLSAVYQRDLIVGIKLDWGNNRAFEIHFSSFAIFLQKPDNDSRASTDLILSDQHSLKGYAIISPLETDPHKVIKNLNSAEMNLYFAGQVHHIFSTYFDLLQINSLSGGNIRSIGHKMLSKEIETYEQQGFSKLLGFYVELLALSAEGEIPNSRASREAFLTTIEATEKDGAYLTAEQKKLIAETTELSEEVKQAIAQQRELIDLIIRSPETKEEYLENGLLNHYTRHWQEALTSLVTASKHLHGDEKISPDDVRIVGCKANLLERIDARSGGRIRS